MNKNYDYYKQNKYNNLIELVIDKYKNNKNDIAFSYKDTNKIIVNKTYEDFYKDIINTSFKIKYSNEHISLIGENSYYFLVLFMALIYTNNVVVIIDKDLDSKTINKMLKNTDTSISIISENYSYLKDKIKGTVLTFNELLSNKNNVRNRKYNIDNEKESIIFFTSGTSGFNKAVMLSQKNIVSDIYAASSLFKPEGTVFSFLPYHHAFGLITSVLKPFNYGMPVFINSSLKYLLDEIKISKPNTLFAVPAVVEQFYKTIWLMARRSKKDKKLEKALKLNKKLLKLHIDIRKYLFKDILKSFGGELEYIICGGAYLDQKYIDWFSDLGIDILNGYGITECSPVVSVNRNFYKRDKSVGQLCRDVSVKIVDEEIYVKGDIVMKGYYNNQKENKKVFDDGYFKTGDFGYVDDDGFLFITGRKKNLIILSNGENISPEIVEAYFSKYDSVCEVVVFEKNNQLVISIYPSDEYLNNQDYFNELVKEYNKTVPKNQQLAYCILRTKEFIKNNNKKILRDKVEL